MNHVRSLLAVACAALVLGGCATPTGSAPSPDDPWEPFNRAMFAINEPLDNNIVKPIIKGYTEVVPRPIRLAISNFYNNIDDLFSAINDGLQGKPEKMGNDLGRVVINSGMGLLGLIDIASDLGIERGNEDFGQTFGVWGFPQGPYLFVPFFGPTTVRDGTGWVVRAELSPFNWMDDVATRNIIWGVALLDARYQAQDALRFVDDAALDRYAFIRRAYLQRRLYLLYDGKIPPDKEE
ncbi:MAG: VacJ family lipoprotein [Proteobacteria bacterium]|nr:VacJ family lipoprotein [Pseudomonadota bacterium]